MKRRRARARWHRLQAGAGSRRFRNRRLRLLPQPLPRRGRGAARLLNEKLINEAIGRPVYLDATDADDIGRIDTGVAHEYLLLHCRRRASSPRFCLLGILEAVRLGIPIVPIAIEGSATTSTRARAFCERRPPNWRSSRRPTQRARRSAWPDAAGRSADGARRPARHSLREAVCSRRRWRRSRRSSPRASTRRSGNRGGGGREDLREGARVHMETSAGRQRGEQRKRLFLLGRAEVLDRHAAELVLQIVDPPLGLDGRRRRARPSRSFDRRRRSHRGGVQRLYEARAVGSPEVSFSIDVGPKSIDVPPAT